jgi:hypothetical protein
MSRGRHARDGQRRDALRAWLRSLLARPVRAIPRARPARAVPASSRRVHPRAAGGAPAPAPWSRAPEAPAPHPIPPSGAGASPQPSPLGAIGDALDELGGLFPGRRDTWVIAQPPPGSPLGYQPVTARPGYVVFPDAKVAVTGPGGVTIGGLAPPAPGRAGDTRPLPVLGGRLYAAHQAQRDRAVNQ